MKLLIILILFYFASGSIIDQISIPLCKNNMYVGLSGKTITPTTNSTVRGYGIFSFNRDFTVIHYQLTAFGFSSNVKSITLYPGSPEMGYKGESFLNTCVEAQIEERWGDESTLIVEPPLIKAVRLGQGYVTIQTEEFPNGEIGGFLRCSQINPYNSYYPCDCSDTVTTSKK
uniref:CHRD chordin domain protein n=1 Tax=Pithovirus LCPAC202 TaxID=2506592 RepID=A0A481Z5V8_9VIRU|nr:MAG: CHRD chordin domain protein [Pithovirus LCPAC202]